MQLSVRVLRDGERVPLLLDERGLPLFYPTLFETAQLRNGGAAVNTIRAIIPTRSHMNTIQFELGGGALLALPADTVAERLIASLREKAHPLSSPTTRARHQIGEYTSGQGGIYLGNIRGDDGTVYGLVMSREEDIGKAAWGKDGSLDLSAWDGLTNTNSLLDRCPAAKLANEYEADGHCDFYLPSRREMMVALANVPHLFGKDSWYWTSSPRTESYAWAVDFEYGCVGYGNRGSEFRVRPFRRFTY